MTKIKYQLWRCDENDVWWLVDFFDKVDDAVDRYDEMKAKAEEEGGSTSWQYELVQVVSAGSGY